jgi:hypothetical protein
MVEETISKAEHEKIMNNVTWFIRIDAAISDAKFEAEKMGKDKQRFIDPLEMARSICQQALIGLQKEPEEKVPPKEP